jgi:hypothetical protein
MTMAIVCFNSGRHPLATAGLAGSAGGGVVATTALALASWPALRQRGPLGWVILAGYAAWGVTVLLWQGIERLLGRGGVWR